MQSASKGVWPMQSFLPSFLPSVLSSFFLFPFHLQRISNSQKEKLEEWLKVSYPHLVILVRMNKKKRLTCTQRG